jgi:hypothetical protein
MLVLSKSNLPDVKEQASYWLSFRQGNDWYSLLDWKKLILTALENASSRLWKAARLGVLDKHISLQAREWRLREMAEDSVGGQLLIGLAAETSSRRN